LPATAMDPAASMAVAGKIVANAEAFAKKRPDDPQALVLLASAYANTSLLTDVRKTARENLPRIVDLLHKAIAVEEKLVSVDPEAPNYRLMLAQAQYNLADAICTAGDCATVADLFRKASPSLVAYADGGKNAYGQLSSLENDGGLAWALYKSGQVADAEKRLLEVVNGFKLIKNAEDNAEVTHAMARTQCRLGELYAVREDWRKAQPLLANGVAGLGKTDARQNTTLDECSALLAATQARLTR